MRDGRLCRQIPPRLRKAADILAGQLARALLIAGPMRFGRPACIPRFRDIAQFGSRPYLVFPIVVPRRRGNPDRRGLRRGGAPHIQLHMAQIFNFFVELRPNGKRAGVASGPASVYGVPACNL